MAGPWEAYQSQAESGPWTQFQNNFPPILPTEPPPDTGFTGALKSSYERMKGEGALLAGKVGLMSLPEAEQYKKEQDEKAEKAFKPTDKGWTEAPVTKLKELAGGSLPYMVAPLAAGAAAAVAAPEAAVLGGLATAAQAAGFAGATTASALQFTGSNLARQVEEGKKLEDTSLLKAGATAVPQALLDTASTFITPGVGRILGRAGIKVGEKEAAEIAKKGILSTAGEYAWQGAKISGIEGATEAGQQFLERLQAGLNLTDEQARKEYYDNFLGGAILGGVMGGAGHAYEKAFPKKAAENLPDAPPTDKKEAEDTAVKILALPAPEEIIADTRRYDPVMNPLGNFIDEDLKDILTPEQVKRINDDRKEAGKPKINSYSIEDVQDAIQNSTDDKGNPLTPEAQQGIMNSLITFKSGYDGTMPITADTVLQMAEEKNVEANTQGFNDFLTRVTGLDNLDIMQPPQLYAAWKALSNLEDSPTLRILPQGTNAVRFTEKQYANALSGLETVFGELGTDALSPTSVKQELKDFSGLERDADVDALYRAAVQRGDLEENITQRKVADGTVKDVTDVSFAGKAEALPGGFDIRHQAFKQGEVPEHYEVRNHRVVMGRAATAEEAQKILDEQTKVNAEVAKKPQATITKLQKDIESRNRVLAEKRATGYFDTDGYKALEAHLNGLNRRAEAQITQLQNDIRNLTNPLSIVPSQTTKPVIGKKHVFYEGEKPLASFGDKYQAEEYGMMRKNEKGEYAVSDAMLQQIIDAAPTTKGILPKRYAEIAKKELARRQGTAPKGIEVRKSIYQPEVDAALEKLKQTLLPQLKKFGLEKVGLRIVNSIADGKADGAYVQSLITVALDAKNPMGVLRHESIHALKDLGAFTPQEWKVLENKAKSEWVDKYIKKAGTYKAYQDAYKAEHKNLNGFEEYINEEAIAEAFKDFANTKPPAGLIGNIYYRIGEMLRGIANVFKRLGFTSSDQIFRKIEAGEMRPAAAPTTTEKKSLVVTPKEEREVKTPRGVIAEVAPNPEKEIAKAWNEMTPQERLETTERVANKVMNRVFDALDLKGYSFRYSTGKYEGDINPNIIIEAPESATTEQLNELARVVGYVLDQKAMVAFDENNTTSGDQAGFVKVVVPNGMSTTQMNKMREHIANEVPQADGDTLRDGALLFGNFSAYNDNVETLTDKQYYDAIKQAVESFDYDGEVEVYEPKRFHSELVWPNNREEYLEGTRYGEGNREEVQAGREGVRGEGGRRLQAIADEAITLRDKWIDARGAARQSSPRQPSALSLTDIETDYGTPTENSTSAVGVHFSQAKRPVISSSYFGYGLKGAEKERLSEPRNRDIKDRIYFYVDTGKGVVPEAGVGGTPHVVRLNNLYDANLDPLRIVKNNKGATPEERSNNLERKIKEEGFDGFLWNDPKGQQGFAVLIGKHEVVMPKTKYSIKAPETEAFKRWFGDSTIVDEEGKPRVMYHGTARDITEFKPKQANAIFLTFKPDFAESFADMSKDYIIKELKNSLTYEEAKSMVGNAIRKALKEGMITPDEAKTLRAADAWTAVTEPALADVVNPMIRDRMETGENVLPVFVRAERPFNYANPDQVAAVVAELNKKTDSFGRKLGDKNAGFISRGSWETIERPDVQAAIKALGHDSFYVLEAGTKNLAVYNPNQIKSATGNIGTFGETGDIRYSIKQQLGQDTIDRINATTFARVEKGWIERLIEAISPTAVVKYRQAFLNKYEAIERLTKRMGREYGADELMAENSAIAAALQSDRAAGVAAASFRDGIPVFRDGYTTIDTNTKGLIPILEPLMAYGDPYVFQAFQYYAATRRGKRLLADGREQLFTADDIKKGDELEKQFPEFKTVFDEYQTYNAGLVKFMKDTGVISDAEAKIWTQNWDYIPFYRQMDGEKTAGPKVFSSISNISKPKELKGGSEELADFVETIVRNSRAAIEAGMKNEAANRVTRDMLRAGLAEEVKTGEETAGVDIVNVKQGGKTVYYRVADPLLVESLKGLNLPQIPFLSFLAAPANVLRNFVTKDPGFMLANLGRDSLQAWITSGTDMKPLIDTFKQFSKTLSNQSPEAVALARAGLTGYDFSGDVASTARQVEKELRKRTGTRTKGEKALLPLSAFWDALEHGSHASDMATRAEVYKRTLERTGSEAEAFYQAMEVLNFSRKGNSAAIRVLSAIVPFFNARIQGLDVLYRSGWGEMATENADTMKKAFAARALTLMGLSMMYWFLVSDDDEYKKLSKEERDNYWIVPAFEVNGKPFRFPIPFELGVVFKVLPERVLETAFGSDTGKDLKESMVRNAMSTLQFNPIPQAFLPIVENVANYSFFTGEPIVGRGMEDVAPQFQVNQGTSVIAKELGEMLNYSPIKIDNFIRGYTGTMGTYAVQLLDAIFTTQGQPVKATMKMEQLPVIKRFFAGDSGSVSAYYDLKGEVDEITRTMNVLERTGNGDDLKEYFDQKGKLYGLKQYVHVLDQNMKQLRQARMAISNSKTMSADEKREALDRIHDAEVAMTFRTKEIRKRFE